MRRILEGLRANPTGRLWPPFECSDGDKCRPRRSSVWNPESGQSLFDFSVRELAENAAPFVKQRESQDLDAEGWYELACDLEIADIEQAEEAYRRAIKLNPAHGDAHVNLGRLLHEKRAPAAAEKHYRAALSADPDHETAAFNLGVALEDLGKIREAIDAYEEPFASIPEQRRRPLQPLRIWKSAGDKATALHTEGVRADETGVDCRDDRSPSSNLKPPQRAKSSVDRQTFSRTSHALDVFRGATIAGCCW